MTAPGVDARRSRRWMAASALAIAGGLAGAVLVFDTVPSATPVAAAVSAPVRVELPARAAGDWSTLTAAQQRTLAPLQPKWEALDPAAKARWIAVAERLQGKPSRAVARAARHMDAWQHLSPPARAQARLRYVMAARMSPAERRRRWDAYQATPHPDRAQGEAPPTLTMVAPALVRSSAGATTVLVTDLRTAALPILRVRAEAATASAAVAPAVPGDAS